MPHFEAFLPLSPFGKGRPRLGRGGHIITPTKTRQHEAALRYFISQHKPVFLDGAIHVQADFFFLRPKSAPKKRLFPTVAPDIDNILKAVLDAGNKLIWIDDSQIVSVAVTKAYAEREGIHLVVSSLDAVA